MLHAKNIENILFLDFVEELRHFLDVTRVYKDDEGLYIRLRLCPSYTMIKGKRSVFITVSMDTLNVLSIPSIALPQPENVFGQSLNNFSVDSYNEILQKEVDNAVTSPVLQVHTTNIKTAKDVVVDLVNSTYEIYLNMVRVALSRKMEQDTESPRYFLSDGEDLFAGYETEPSAREALIDYLINNPGIDGYIIDTKGSLDEDEWVGLV